MIKFTFSPFHSILSANDWSRNVVVDSPKIIYDSHEFEDDRILVMNYQINESVEGETLKWTLSYDNNKFLSDKNIH